MITELYDIHLLQVNEQNPRTITESKFKKLVRSIEELPAMMELRPIIIDENHVALGGNMRLRALKHIGWKQVPAQMFTRDHATAMNEEHNLNKSYEDYCREIIIKDNISAGEWEWEEPANTWDTSELEDWGLDTPDKWKAFEKKAAKEDHYQVPVDIKTDIQLGDIIRIGEHLLICGDSTDPADTSQLIEDDQVDLMITYPPYNVDYHSADGKSIDNDNMGDSEFRNFLTQAFDCAESLMKSGAPFYIFHASSEAYNFIGAAKDALLPPKQTLVWVKNTFVLGRQDYKWQHEPILYGWKEGAGHKWYGHFDKSTVIEEEVDVKGMKKQELLDYVHQMQNKYQADVLHFQKPAKNGQHPTMKPIELVGRLVENSSTPGDLVLDLFGGSGSTMVACHQLDRVARLMELDPKYCQVIVDRMIELDPELPVTINDKPYKK